VHGSPAGLRPLLVNRDAGGFSFGLGVAPPNVAMHLATAVIDRQTEMLQLPTGRYHRGQVLLYICRRCLRVRLADIFSRIPKLNHPLTSPAANARSCLRDVRL
jgi:hypothetical protein